MKLSKINLNNFKSHKSVSIDLDDITVLIGENDTGKSSILEAINWVFGNLTKLDDNFIPLRLKDKDSKITISVSATLSISEDIDSEFEEYLTTKNSIEVKKSQDFYSKSRSSFEIKKLVPQLSFSEFKSLKAKKQKEILKDLAIKSNYDIDNEMISNSDKREGQYHIIKTKLPDDHWKEQWIKIPEKITDKLPKAEMYDASSFSDPEKYYKKILSDKFRKSLEIDEIKESATKLKDALSTEIANHKPELLEIMHNYDDTISELEVIPVIDFSRGLQSINIIVEKQGDKINLFQAGDGTRRRAFLSLLESDTKLSQIDDQSIIKLYDEPDTSLHYRAEMSLFGNLKEMSKLEKRQVIIATHSSNIINQVSLTNIKAFSSENGHLLSSLNQYNDDPNDILNILSRVLGIENIKLLTTKCFIFVEGENDIRTITNLFETYTGSPPLTNAISIEKYDGTHLTVLLEFAHDNFDNYIITADTDKKEKKQYSNLLNELGEDRMVFFGYKEFEDMFDNDLIIDILNERYPKRDEISRWTEQEVQDMIDSEGLIKSLSSQVQINSGIEFKKRDFNDAISEMCTIRQIPVELTKVFDIALSY